MLSRRFPGTLAKALVNKVPTVSHGLGCGCCTRISLQRDPVTNLRYFNTCKPTYSTRVRTQDTSGQAITFVSEHYNVNESEMIEFLDRKNLSHKAMQGELVIKECPFCHDTKGVVTNLWKLYISRKTGAFMCHRCGNKGSWYDFKNKLDRGSAQNTPTIVSYQSSAKGKSATNQDDETKIVFPSQENCDLYEAQLMEEKFAPVSKYLTGTRGINMETAEKYGIGAGTFNYLVENEKTNTTEWKQFVSITFPMIRPTSGTKMQIVRHKFRAIHNKSAMKLDPVGGQWGLFGYATIPKDAKTIVLTEGEFDAMAVYQATGLPSISLPNGCRSLPVNLLPLLERFDKIYLWMDDDLPGQQGAELFAKKLGVARCFIVHSNIGNVTLNDKQLKDANEVLLYGNIDMKELLDQAKPLQHDQIMTYSDLKDEIFRELYFHDSRMVNGIQSIYFPRLINKILKGHRRGELTIITGATGIGKTTILGQLALDFSLQGISTLWGSFEIKNVRLVKKMLCQLAGKDLAQNQAEFEGFSQTFEKLPQYFMSFYGSTSIDQVLDAMDYAVYVNDVQHIVLDNLQFMLSGQGQGYDRFELQDRAVHKLRAFANAKNVHISLVVHPRKVDDMQELGLSSVFGTAKATQEADNVIIIQRGRHYRYISVKKNRFDGTTGEVPYRFEKDSNRIVELTREQIDDLEAGRLEIQY
jgi:twinkle protein